MAMLIFVGVALGGLLLLLISALTGGDHDTAGEYDHAAEMGHDVTGPKPLSLRVIFLFITTFGAAGAIACTYKLSAAYSSLIGVACGLVTGAAGWQLMRVFWKQQASSTVTRDDIHGAAGEVKTAIPEGGVGQVSIVARGQRLYPRARSADGKAIEEGALVKVLESAGDSVIVERSQPR
jgi:membrane-bound ClpP family serine protease